MKKCNWCEIWKSLEIVLQKRKDNKTGYYNICKSCQNKMRRLRYQKDYIRIDARNKKWNAAHPDVMRDAWRKYGYRNRNKRAIQGKLQRAVKSGRITKPTVCSDCGCNDKIQAHHSDYSDALNVLWLCHRCHKAIHREERSLV